MASMDEIKKIVNHVQDQHGIIEHNHELFNIYEGDLLKYVLKDLRSQLRGQTYEQMQHRVAPVNILKKLIDKLSKIYNKQPARDLYIDSEKDKELMSYYTEMYKMTTNGDLANEIFNLNKNTAWEPYVLNGRPYLRTLPADRFSVYSNDRVDPTNMTHFIKFMGKMKKGEGYSEREVDLYYIYSDEDFIPVDSEGDVVIEILMQNQNPDGINPYGKIPFIYINRSHHSLIPPIDTDLLKMTKIIPVLLSDLNFAVMFQSFSIIYGIDIDDENIQMSPNAFWRFNSDPSKNNKPEIGSIKPEVDIGEVMNFIISQISIWFQSRNIRTGSIGDLSAENFASGISKIIDEMDTFEERQKQVPFFKEAEESLWDLTINHLHPVWKKQKVINQKLDFSAGQYVTVTFAEQKPNVKREDLLNEIEREMKLGLITTEDAYRRLHPDLTDDELQEKLLELSKMNIVEIEEDGSEDQTAENKDSNT